MQRLPLEGVRVVDFCDAWHGPHLTQWLGVMGAEVIKIESALRPNSTRTASLPGKSEPAGFNRSVDYGVFNYGKMDITLNMTQPKAVELVKKLVKVSDVVTENFGGAVLDRWGLGYQDLRKIKRDIIVYAGSGYGRTGPRKEFPAFAGVADAFSGMGCLNGYASGKPLVIGSYGWTDMLSGQQGAFAVLAALYHRSLTGEGQYIDLSMSEVGLTFIPEVAMDYVMNKRVRQRVGNRDDIMAPHGCYRCQGEDRWVAIAVSNQEEWQALCNAVGHPEWATREEFRDELSRWKNQDELDKLIGEWTINYDHYEVMERLQKAGVMAGASLSPSELVSDPQLRERGFFVDLEHPEMSKLTLAGLPWKLSDTPKGNYLRPALLGEHNNYVFGELLGLSREEIKQLQEEKVIY